MRNLAINSTKGKYRLLICFVLIFVFSEQNWMIDSWAVAGDDSPVCIDCHDDKQSARYVHYPAGEGDCKACHEPTPEHLAEGGPGGMKTNRTASACYQCHDTKSEGLHIHPALKMDGECVQCHNPHGSDSKKFLVMPINRICFECHNPIPADAGEGSEHNVVGDEKSCLNCHDPHSTDQDSLLITNPKTLCLNCHDREITVKEGVKTRKVADIKQKVLEMEFVHQPVIWCTACHDSHGSKYRSLLAGSFPKNNYNKYEPGDYKTKNTFELCFGCHDQAMLNETITADDTGFRNDTIRDGEVVRENLHWFHVVNAAGSENRGRSCNICHDLHGSNYPHNIRTSWIMKKQNLVLKFKNRPNGGECMKSCHSLKYYQRID